jgi:hypothetical protein
MAALTPVDAALSVGQRIGRYFAQVSLIPALLLVLWIYILIASGSLSGKPSMNHIEAVLSHWDVAKVAGLVLVSLAVAVVVHPLQFATTQLLEGYWGAAPLAVAAMKVRVVHHRKRQRELWEKATSNGETWRDICLEVLRKDPEWQEDPEMLEDRISAFMQSERGDRLMLHVIAEQEAGNRYEGNYPSDATRIMPTQLGNALRRFEDDAGRQYGLSAITISPHLHLIAPPRHLDYLIDARQDMDSTIRICTVGFIATVLTVGFLLTDGLWLLWAMLPYSISYLAYKGAVSSAQSYGSVIAGVIDLDRFLLYDRLGLYQPRDNKEERESNTALMTILAGDNAENVTVRYRRENKTTEHPASSLSRRRKSGF